MEDFYNAMSKYVDSKKPKCCHERTFKWCGWKTCVDCGLCLRRLFSQDLYSNLRGYSVRKQKQRLPKIREIMTEMIRSVTKQKPEIPPEIEDHLNELSRACLDASYNVKCHTRSLCAAVLWNKIKSSYPNSKMKLVEFSKRVDVSVTTIINTCKKLKL